jgi:hypothetical protein
MFPLSVRSLFEAALLLLALGLGATAALGPGALAGCGRRGLN